MTLAQRLRERTEVECVSAMAWDAFRLALGFEPRTFTSDEVLRWMRFRVEHAAIAKLREIEVRP